jgi:hypothetical protein
MDKQLIQVRIERLVRGEQDMFGVTGYVREARDAQFDPKKTVEFLAGVGAQNVELLEED